MSLPTNRITMVTLGVQDLDKAAAFYAALGWVAEPGPPGVVFHDIGGAKFGLFSRADMAHEQRRASGALGTGAMSLSVNFPTPTEVDAAFDAAIQAGATAIRRPAKMDWGGYSAYWCDPDGHVWEYAFNPFWPLDPNGRLSTPEEP